METQKFYYDNRIVKAFIYATVIWGIIGFILGLTVASLLVWPDIPEYLFGSDVKDLAKSQGSFGYGRLRMLHTSAVIFAFVGNSIFTGIYYSLQRLLKARMYSDVLSWINFWGWQLILVLVVITFLMGLNTSKEYAEHEWPIDILTALIWITFGVNMFGTILKRRVRHLYVAIWFYIATWIGITLLHVFNNLAVPLNWDILNPKSYSVYAGVQDALVQWWYGHNAVAFFLTTPVLGLMYYYMPKAANRPVFSYKLSIIHFWSLIFVYIWAGPHHLLYTALPPWAQALGTAFSIMLIAPSWGGMLNGLLTLRGAWDKVREEPILKFFVVAITCYGMGTFEGPLLATKTLNKVGHFTDWVIAHVHVSALGWNGFMAFGVVYYILPRIFKTELFSKKLANAHFWLGTLGIIFYAVPMYISGMSQGLMLKQFNPDGTLAMKNWLEMITQITPFLFLRVVGGTLYVTGSILMGINVYKTVWGKQLVANEAAEAPALAKITTERKQGEGFHLWLERMPLYLSVGSFIVLAIGGMVEILPTLMVKSNIPTISAVKPYSPLELEGRDLYIREGCNACHSQMIRPFRDEVARFTGGWTAKEYSKAGEFVYDRPFLWGSKRTGPDLARQGKKNQSSWHFKHMLDPRSTSPGSIMPRYPWLIVNQFDDSRTTDKIKLMKNSFDVPYSDKEVAEVAKSVDDQQKQIIKEIYSEAEDIKEAFDKEKLALGAKFVPLEKREITALISYLQRLGIDIKATEPETASK